MTMTAQQLREKISLWLSNPDCDTDFNTFVYFLVDECGVVLKEDEEEEEYCFKNTTIDSVETDICFCSVGGCAKPTEFDEEEEEEPYLCVDCGKDFKWKSGTSSAGAGANSYHCGSCGCPEWEAFNKKHKEEDEPLYVGNCMKCSKKNDGDWDNNSEDPICIECGEIWKYNENDDSYSKIIKEEEDEEEGHYIVYGEYLEYDDDGECSGTYNDGFYEFKSKEEALLEYNRLIKNNDDKEYDLIYLDYIEGEGAEADQDNVECWEKPEEKPKKKIKFRVK